MLRVIYTTYDLPNPESDKFNFRFFGNQINNGDIIFELNGYASEIKIYWGDGTSDTFITNTFYYPTHTYATTNNYIIEIELITLPTSMNLFVIGLNVSNIKNLKQFTNINERYISFTNGFLTSSDVNSVLNQAVVENWNGSNIIIDLSGNTPPAPPTGQGITDKATLIANSSAGQIITD